MRLNYTYFERRIDMKRTFGLLLTALLIQTASAEVTFFNKSTQRNIEVTYQYCYLDAGSDEKCTELETSTINSKSYLTVQPPTFPENTSWQFIYLMSATEKDHRGNVIAKGEYGKNCNEPVTPFSDTSTAIELDDMNLSPMILCRASGY